MSKKAMKGIFIGLMILALVVVPVLAFFSEAGAEVAYEVPRMLGMESEEHEVARLEGPPTTDVVGPIVETHRPAVSFDKDLRELPQTGPKDKKPAREMGTPPNAGPNGDGVDAVVQTDAVTLAAAPAPLTSFKGLDLQSFGAGWPPDTHGDVGP